MLRIRSTLPAGILPPLVSVRRSLDQRAVRTAIALLREAAGAQGRVAMLGISRGSEAALLLGADFPDLVSAVPAYVPSSRR